MSDLSNPAPQPFNNFNTDDAVARMYGDAHANEPKAADPVLDSDASKLLWPDFAEQEQQRIQPPVEDSKPESPDNQGDDGETPDIRSTFDQHATALGIDSTNAEKLFSTMAPVVEARQKEAVEAQIDAWTSETEDHFGDGLDEAMSYARHALESHDGGSELMAFLDKAGLSSNKHVVTFLNAVGRSKRGGR